MTEVQKSTDPKKEKVIEVLNKARSMELYSITQYMNQHFALDNDDYGELAKNVKLISIDEMRHAEEFAERIKDLDGEPTARQEGELKKGQGVREIFRFNNGVEDHTIQMYNEFVKVCRENGDQVSANLFERIIEEEQEHTDYFDDVANHIQELGDHYLAKIAGTSSSTGGYSKGFTNKD